MNSNQVSAAIYLRISQDPKEDGLAVERQEADCVAIVKSRGWAITKTYTDTVSASKRNVARPSYEQMLKDFVAGEFNALVCWDLDRLTRQPRQLEDWIDAAVDKGLILVTANGEADLSNDNGRLFARMKAAVARAEIERKSARQKRKNEQLVSDGRPVPGRRRFGYLSDNMTANADEVPIVLRAFQEVADGRSLRSIATELGWRPVRLRDMLTHRSYIGEVVHHGAFRASDKIAAIVPIELFESVQILLGDPTRKTSPGSSVAHLLSGLTLCGICDSKMHYQNGYMCSKSTAHVHIKKETLESFAVWSVYDWARYEEQPISSLGNSAEVEELLIELSEINRQRGIQQELAVMEGADLNLVKAKLSELGFRGEQISTKLFELRSNTAKSKVLEAVKAAWQRPVDAIGFEKWSASMDDAAKLLGIETHNYSLKQYEQRLKVVRSVDEWLPFWNGLELEIQREVVRSLFEITVNKGRTLERITLSRRV